VDPITQSCSERHGWHVGLVAGQGSWFGRENTEETSEEGPFVGTLPRWDSVNHGVVLLGVSGKMQSSFLKCMFSQGSVRYCSGMFSCNICNNLNNKNNNSLLAQ